MRSHNDTPQGFYMADVSTAGQIHVPIHEDGFIKEISVALNGALATADAVLTAKINGTAITGGVLTITQVGSTYGDIVTVEPTGANEVSIGDFFELETDGASGNTISVHGYFVIGR